MSGSIIFRNIYITLPFEIVKAMFNQDIIEVFTTQVSVAVRRQHIKHTILNSKQGNVESTSS